MDEELILFSITGFISGIAGAGINTFLNYRALNAQLSVQKTGTQFQNFLNEQIHSGGNKSTFIQIDQIKSDILNLFDNFMSHQLTAKMPVLNMFMDEKLISEIRVVFHDEMESHLPALMEKNLFNENSISSITELLRSSIKKLLNKSRRRIFISILAGGFLGGLIGFITGICIK